MTEARRIILWRLVKRAFYLESIEVMFAVLCILSALTIILFPASAPVAVTVLPYWAQNLWASFLGIGGILNAVGILSGNVYLRRAGLFLLCGASSCLALLLFSPWGGFRIFGGLTYACAAFCVGTRIRLLGKTKDALHLLIWAEEAEQNRKRRK